MTITAASDGIVAAMVMALLSGGSLVQLHLSGGSITTTPVALLIYTRAVSSTLVSVDSSCIALQLKCSHIIIINVKVKSGLIAHFQRWVKIVIDQKIKAIGSLFEEIH